MKTSLAEQISEYIDKQTSTCLYAQNYQHLGVNATTISKTFYIDRTNASRILNQLFHSGMLCKKVGRPTLYISLKALQNVYPNNNVPKIIASNQHVENFLRQKKDKPSIHAQFNFPHIGNSPNEALYTAIEKTKRILLYPSDKKIIFLNGTPGIKKDQFMKAIIQYYTTVEIKSTSTTQPYYITESCISQIIIKVKDHIHEHSSQSLFHIIIEQDITQEDCETLSYVLHHEFQYLHNRLLCILDIKLGKANEYIENFLPVISLPTYFDLTAKEKIEHVFEFLHQEATKINRTISFSKNMVCCIIMCNLIGSLENLYQLLHLICMNVYAEAQTSNDLKLTLESLPENILPYIEGCANDIEHINNVFHAFSTTTFYAFPGIEFTELNLLLETELNEQQEIVYRSNIDDDSILAACRHELQNAKTIYQDIHIQDTLDFQSLKELLKQHIDLNDHATTTLTYHIYHALDQIRNHTYQEKSILNDKSEYILLSKKVSDFIRDIENTHSIQIPLYEKIYINTFIIYSTHAQLQSNIGIIFCMSSPKLSDVYSLTMNQTYHENFTTSSSIAFSKFYDDYEHNYQIFVDELKSINCQKGILILTNTYLPFNLIHSLKKDVQPEIKVSTNLSDVAIKKIYTIYHNERMEFSDFSFLDEYESQNTNEITLDAHSNQNLFDVLNETLQNQLSFLDVYKIVPILTSIYQSVLKELALEFSNNLLITFLMHTSFVIERSIKNEPLPYKSINTLQRKHSKVYNTIYQNFQTLETFFHCHIAESELAYVVEMFVDAIAIKENQQ